MKHKILNNFKGKAFLLMCCLSVLFAFTGCESDTEDSRFGVDTEPKAAIGFSTRELLLNEGEMASAQLSLKASKVLFNDVTFNLEVYENEAGAGNIVFSDNDGNTGPSFTIPEGKSQLDINITVTDNDVKWHPNYKVRYRLSNLEGAGAFIARKTYTGNTQIEEQRIDSLLTVRVTDNDPPPAILSIETSRGVLNETDTEAYQFKVLFSKATTVAGTFDLVLSGDAVVGTNFTLVGESGGVVSVPFDVGTDALIIEVTPVNTAVTEDYRNLIFTIANVDEDFFSVDTENFVHTLKITDDEILRTEYIFEPVMDAQTIGAPGSIYASNNYGNPAGNSYRQYLEAGNDVASGQWSSESFLKFDYAAKGIDPSKILDATIILTTANESSNWKNVETAFGNIPSTQKLYHVTDDSWDNLTITGNNEPASASIPFTTFTSPFLIGTSGQTRIEHEYVVTDLIISDTDGKLSVRLAVNDVDTGSGTSTVRYFSTRAFPGHPRIVINVRQ